MRSRECVRWDGECEGAPSGSPESICATTTIIGLVRNPLIRGPLKKMKKSMMKKYAYQQNNNKHILMNRGPLIGGP